MTVETYIALLSKLHPKIEIFKETGDYNELVAIAAPTICGISIGPCGITKTLTKEIPWKIALVI